MSVFSNNITELTQYSHSVRNLTKWFIEVNINALQNRTLDSYGMTKNCIKSYL
ncbi:hypothetical protein HNQ03_002059 [Chryseobacterium sp. 16F]|uniref:Uncharacterized protein n=1 Tax=Frigoriflavimonas asaccharolytica TaxID=2735899 RepID=A0A8J8G955_9FLAO|nr:hypothetical protein [Frigoriflavimonas asaccharolytica]